MKTKRIYNGFSVEVKVKALATELELGVGDLEDYLIDYFSNPFYSEKLFKILGLTDKELKEYSFEDYEYYDDKTIFFNFR